MLHTMNAFDALVLARLSNGVEMNPQNFPQFYNPEKHEPDCANPDKLFRFCECPGGPT